MPSSDLQKDLKKKHARSLLLRLLNLLADFDGQICREAVPILEELRQRSDVIPPLYADVFGLPLSATCQQLVYRIETLSQQQVAVASYGFQIFRTYEQLLKVDTTQMAPKQQVVQELQLERMRSLVARTRLAIEEAIEPQD